MSVKDELNRIKSNPITSQRAKELIAKGCQVVINDDILLLEFLRMYSFVFLGSKPCEWCTKYHSGYFERFKNSAIKILKTMEDNKFRLKDGIIYTDRISKKDYSSANMTDAVAIAMLKAYPHMAKNFVVLPENWEEVVKGVDEDLSKLTVKALKAIAKDKGITLKHNAKKESIIAAIDE